VLWLRNATGVKLYGYGGNACPCSEYPAGFAQFKPSLFRVEDSTNIDLVSLTSYEMGGTLAQDTTALKGVNMPGCTGSRCKCLAPDQWLSVFEVTPHSNITSRILDRPVLWRRTAAGRPLKSDDDLVKPAEPACTHNITVPSQCTSTHCILPATAETARVSSTFTQ
jgi:hypothetical protein